MAQGELANQIALISGQGPTAETAANCPNYTDVAPGTVGVGGQVEGSGCVYPAATQTLPGQLAANMKWKAYVEDIGNGGRRTADHLPAPGAWQPRRQPGSAPGRRLRDLAQPVRLLPLADRRHRMRRERRRPRPARARPQAATSTPTLSYIVPNACHDGGEQPCEPGQPSGPVAAESFLQTVVPEIEASPAYKEGGLIAITSAQAPQTGPHADPSACCVDAPIPEPARRLGSAPASTGPVKPTGGGGRVGLLLISPFVKAGSVNETGYYNHFALLRSIEELFSLEPLGYAAELALTGFDSTVYNALNAPV